MAIEDDGIADNGAGGWTDEGINDRFLYPALPAGAVERNGHRFRLLDPAANEGRGAVMLRGERRGLDQPESVRVAVPDVAGRFVYFIHHGVGGAAARPGYEAAVYTVTYADGREERIPIVQNRHLLHGWASSWWENRGARELLRAQARARARRDLRRGARTRIRGGRPFRRSASR